ncbi:hypothetical protein [Acinetobacter baumannii]|uniref:hypothetical protein n=1 Tax=Acinetobacter baumannii TaxID=470 RepID=UPI003FA46312|nr:hypothetical protein [Acinetobacter baumannii]
MAETEKIAQMAEILSDELFTEFFWQKQAQQIIIGLVKIKKNMGIKHIRLM